MRTVLQTGLLNPNTDCVELYYRIDGCAERCADGLVLQPSAVLDFGTYFNCLPIGKYAQYTNYTEIAYRFDFRGTAKIGLWHMTDGEPVLFAEQTAENGAEIAADTQDGVIFPTVQALGEVEFYGFDVAGDTADNAKKIAVAFCTFRRERYVKANVAKLVAAVAERQAESNFGIFVVDNGRTLTAEDVAGAHLIPNSNSGGSGGFTRGIVAALDCGDEYSHVLLMDDDVSFESEIFFRTHALLLGLKDVERTTIGGAMLRLDEPWLQYECGAQWNGKMPESLKRDLDMRTSSAILENEREERVDYSAWWYSCIPLATVRRIGLPFPLFIKDDDVEYGLRARNRILTFTGIGLWHESFDNKFSGELEYYVKRNELIVNAIYCRKCGAWFNFKKLVRGVGLKLVRQQYPEVKLEIRAYRDFLKGPQWLYALDPEQMHVELRKACTQQYSAEELMRQGVPLTDLEPYEPRKKIGLVKEVLTLNGYLIPTCCYDKQTRRVSVCTAPNPQPPMYYKSKNVVQYNPIVDRGFVTRQKRTEVLVTGFRLIGIFFALAFRYRSVAKQYRTKVRELSADIRK